MANLSAEQEQKVIDNLNLVRFTLKKMHVNLGYSDYDDYFQEGCIGLILAVQRFDESRGFQFSTFAISYIQGQIRRYKRDRERFIRVSRTDYDAYVRMLDLIGQGYSLSEIPDELGISPMRLNHLISTYSVGSIHAEVDGKDGGKVEVGDMVADWRNGYNDLLDSMSFEQAFQKVLSDLHGTTKDICEEWFYTRMYGENLPQDYFTEKYDLSQANVSRILKRFKQNLLFYLGMEL